MDSHPTHIELFAGAGGGLYTAGLLGWRTVCAVEKDPYCQKILIQRQKDGIFDPFPIWDDCRTFEGKPWGGVVDIVSAGFPCQPWSKMSHSRGESHKRNLWPDTIRIVREIRPDLVFLENVPALTSHSSGYFGEILRSMANSGFDVAWSVLGARDCGAPHIRRRLWILGAVSNPKDKRLERCRRKYKLGEPFQKGAFSGKDRWSCTPTVQRMVDGLANRRNRLAALGNGQVPIVAATAFKLLFRRLTDSVRVSC